MRERSRLDFPTTREHIYSQATQKSERLREANLDDVRVIVRMSSYSFEEKARILYNHIYFSDIPAGHRSEVLRDNFFLEIVKHEKFNPRLIEWLSNHHRIRAVAKGDYRKFIKRCRRSVGNLAARVRARD